MERKKTSSEVALQKLALLKMLGAKKGSDEVANFEHDLLVDKIKNLDTDKYKNADEFLLRTKTNDHHLINVNTDKELKLAKLEKKVKFKICNKCKDDVKKDDEVLLCKECFTENSNNDLTQKLICEKCNKDVKVADVVTSCHNCYSDLSDNHYDEFIHVLLSINTEIEKLKEENKQLVEKLHKSSL